MSIKVSTLKALLWGCATLLTALSYPMQVYANSPMPALLPYVLIGMLVVLTSYWPPRPDHFGMGFSRSGNIDLVVTLYVFLVFFDCGWQAAVGAISPGETISALVNYVLPVTWYWYFRRYGSDREICMVLRAMLVAGLIVGIFFAYDSYLKLALQQLSPYASKALEYSINRSGLDPGAVSDSRVAANFRSYGLLETHSVSGGWVMLGAFAALALTPPNRRIVRRLWVLLFGSMLLVGLNFTSIVAFSLVVLLFEFGGVEVLRGRFSSRIAGNMAWLVGLVAVLLSGVLWAVGDVMAQFLVTNLMDQGNFALALGAGASRDSMLGITILNIMGGADPNIEQGYLRHLLEYPMTAAWGDGFASYGLAKGGDVGWVESLARFGIPFFLLIAIGLARVITAGVREARARARAEDLNPHNPHRLDQRRLLEFAVSVALMAIVTDLHYTVWASKSVFPIVFFSLALFSRYLSSAPRASLKEAPV